MLAREADEKITSSSTTSNCSNNGSTNVDIVEESTQNKEAADINESPMIDTSQNLQCIGTTSGKMEKFKNQEDKSHEFSRRPPKRSQHRDLKAPSSVISARSLTLHLVKKSASMQHYWMVEAIRKNLSTELQGWWGRLAFHPMPSLITQASCYVSSKATDCTCPMPDKVLVTQSLLEVGSSSKPLVHNGDLMAGTRPLHVGLDVASNSNHFFPETRYNNIMPDSISKAFGQVAADLQVKFLTLLETMDVQEHQAKSQEAVATFAALDRLMFDHQDLKDHTMKYISCAMTLSEIKQSMQINDSYHNKLLDHCCSERMRLDEINRIHAETVQNMTSSRNHLKVLQEQISSTKNWLFLMETKLSFFEDEMKNMELLLHRISESKDELEEGYVIAAKELEESRRLGEHKKAEHDGAKAASDRARSLLRGY